MSLAALTHCCGARSENVLDYLFSNGDFHHPQSSQRRQVVRYGAGYVDVQRRPTGQQTYGEWEQGEYRERSDEE